MEVTALSSYEDKEEKFKEEVTSYGTIASILIIHLGLASPYAASPVSMSDPAMGFLDDFLPIDIYSNKF